jgi:hypothetical protein
MIELICSDNDDVEFLALVRRVICGAVLLLKSENVYVICIDNWFDFKWREFSGKAIGAVGVWAKRTTIPPFHPNRVRSQQRYTLMPDHSGYAPEESGKPIHVSQPSEHNLRRSIARLFPSSMLVWYSGNTRRNAQGSLMMYVNTSEVQTNWYASFENDRGWRFKQGDGITARELRLFEERGSEIEATGA